MGKWKTLLFLLIAATLVLAACGDDKTEANGEGYRLVNDGKLTYAASGLYKPFNFEENGELTGFDMEIGAEIAERWAWSRIR